MALPLILTADETKKILDGYKSNNSPTATSGLPDTLSVEETKALGGVNPFISERPKEKSLGQKILDVGSSVADFVGAKGISDQFGADIARARAPTEQQKNLIEYPSMKEVVGSAIQTGANLIPEAGIGRSFLAKTAAGLGTGYAYDVGAQLQNKNKSVARSFVPGIGTAVGGALPGLATIVGKGLKNVAGFTSGTGSDVLQRAFNDPEAVGKAVATYAKTPEARQELVDRAKNSIQSYLSQRSAEYGKSINELTSTVGFQGKQSVTDSFAKNIERFGGTIHKGNLIFKDSTLTKADQNNLRQAYSTINKWRGTSVKGLDQLRQAIGNLMEDYKISGNTRANNVLGSVKEDLTKFVSKNAPGYGAILKDYGVKTQTAKQLLKELNLGGAAKETTQLGQVMRLFKKDPGVVTKLTEVMGKKDANNFLNEISGAILSDWIPAGKLGNYIRGAGEIGGGIGAVIAGHTALGAGSVGTSIVASSPRIVGKAARLLGKAQKVGVNKLLDEGLFLGAEQLQND